MNDGQNINLVRFDMADDPVGSFDHLSNLVHVVFRNTTAGKGEVGNLLRASSQAINRAVGNSAESWVM